MHGLMRTRMYAWHSGGLEHELRFVPVAGTAGSPYLFGAGPHRRPIEVRDFAISRTPVTQALWTRVMGSNPSEHDEPRHPIDNVSWNDIAAPGGFLERINSSDILAAVAGSESPLRFRLPSE